MKKTKNIFAIIAMCGLLTLSACTGKDNSGTTTGTTDNSQTTTSTGSLEEINAQLDDLYQQENKLFAEHKDAWDKAFSMMNKGNADPNGSYVDYLTSTVAPASSSLALISLASSIEMFSLIGEPALSTKSLDSFNPRPVISRTTLITATLAAPASEIDTVTVAGP